LFSQASGLSPCQPSIRLLKSSSVGVCQSVQGPRAGSDKFVLRSSGSPSYDDGGERLGANEGEAFFLTAGRGHRGRNLAPSKRGCS